MRGIRRKEKEIKDSEELHQILQSTKYITIAMASDDEPYLVTLSHGYEPSKKCVYFHCAKKGKKIDILSRNPIVWGQALLDLGYAKGKCDHLYATVQFRGEVKFITSTVEKRHALRVMIDQLEENPDVVYDEQVTESSVERVNIGRIDIDYMTGKKSNEVIISM